MTLCLVPSWKTSTFAEAFWSGYSVYVGKIDTFEVDFVAQNQNGNTYIQVAAGVRDSSTLERELKPLKMIKDNYVKMILTLDDDPESDHDGITRKNVQEWLMEDKTWAATFRLYGQSQMFLVYSNCSMTLLSFGLCLRIEKCCLCVSCLVQAVLSKIDI